MSKSLRITSVLFIILMTSQFIFAGRYYDPATGRFLQVDPLANKYPSLSPYIYVANNPLKYIDPDGRKIEYVEIPEGIGQRFRSIRTPASLAILH